MIKTKKGIVNSDKKLIGKGEILLMTKKCRYSPIEKSYLRMKFSKVL